MGLFRRRPKWKLEGPSAPAAPGGTFTATAHAKGDAPPFSSTARVSIWGKQEGARSSPRA